MAALLRGSSRAAAAVTPMSVLRVVQNRWVGTVLFALAFTGFCFAYVPLPVGRSFPTLWPASGFLLAVLLLVPSKEWWRWVLIAAAISIPYDRFHFDRPWSTAVTIALARSIQVTVQAWLINRWCGRPMKFERTADVLIFTAVVAVVNGLTTVSVSGLIGDFTERGWAEYVRARWAS